MPSQRQCDEINSLGQVPVEDKEQLMMLKRLAWDEEAERARKDEVAKAGSPLPDSMTSVWNSPTSSDVSSFVASTASDDIQWGFPDGFPWDDDEDEHSKTGVLLN